MLATILTPANVLYKVIFASSMCRSSGRPTSLLPSKRYLNSNYTVDHRKVRQLAIQELFGEEKAAFTQHFVLYTFSVLIRTALEVAFIWLQVNRRFHNISFGYVLSLESALQRKRQS